MCSPILDRVKLIIKLFYPLADCGLFFSRNLVGDQMDTIRRSCSRSQIGSAKTERGEKMLKRLIDRIRHRRFCRLNGYYCPDCIYHDFVFEGSVFRGNKCRWKGANNGGVF